MPATPRITVRVALALAVAATARPVRAQLPGLPVLQSAFAARRGLAIGANAGGGGGQAAFAAAGSWVPGGARVQFSVGAGLTRGTDSTGATSQGGSGGARVSYRIRSFGDAIALGIFGGLGGARIGDAKVYTVPIGASLAYRRAVGETGAIGLFASPFFGGTRTSANGASTKTQRLRASVGGSIGFGSIGVTIGVESGAEDKTGAGGGVSAAPRTLVGGGVSYAF